MTRRNKADLREQIIMSSLQVLSHGGQDALTMRKVAARLDIAPMTIYGYFESKDELCDAIAATLLDNFHVPPEVEGSWDQNLFLTMSAFHQALLLYPAAVPLLTDRRIVCAGLVRFVDAVLRNLIVKAGIPPQEAVRDLAILYSFTVGFVSFRRSRYPDSNRLAPDDVSREQDAARRLRALSQRLEIQTTAEYADLVAAMFAGDSYEEAVRILIAGLCASLASAESTDSPVPLREEGR